MKKLLFLLCLIISLFALAQKDSISINATLHGNQLSVKQKITYYNKSEIDLTQIKLLNYVSAYKNRKTNLLKRKLEDRKTELYYANNNQQGKLLCLTVNNTTYPKIFDSENIYIEIPTLSQGNSATIYLEYTLQLPDAQFTGYGTAKDYTLLKYFFLVPDSFDKENNITKNYLDIEETANVDTYYKINIASDALYTSSNLKEISPKTFEGILNKDVEIYLSNDQNFKREVLIEGQKHSVEFGYPLTEDEQKYIEFYLPLQLKFINEKTGFLPNKIFISRKSRAKNDFFGNDDIKFWKFKFQLFNDAEKIDLDYISIISQEIADQIFVTNKNDDHWLTNGLKTYIEIQYLERFYKNYNLLGQLGDYKILGLKPLKYTYAAKLKLLERYGLPYQYIMAQNLDQKIDEKLQKLSNFNEFAISKFETGSLLNFIGEKMGKQNIEDFFKAYIKNNKNKILNKKDFLDQLTIKSGYSSEFLESFIEHKQRVNFKLKSFEKEGDQFKITVSKNTTQNIPFKLETLNDKNEKTTYWYDTNFKENPYTYVVPDLNTQKIIINDNYAFPESNFRDNYLYTKGLFNNTKKIKLKFFTDNPNPEYHEIYMAPKLAWNYYDKFLLGIKFQNKSLFDRPFLYSFLPFYSTGTNTITGSFAASYKIQPAESFYRSLNLGFSTSYFHYDKNLAYKTLSLSASMSLNKNPRSQIGRNIVASYSHVDKQLSEKMLLANDYSSYNLWNFGFIYSENGIIKDKYLFGNLQLMEDYQKLSAESYYRWEYAKDKKLSLRFFGGVFINNHTRNNTFDLGISRVSNYAFSYNLLAQSASSGIFAQQFIIAEGGFKSYINGTANQFVFATNVDAHAWKMFNIYADFGAYKNKYSSSKFIWDSGVKLKVIPDFLEIYFPVQSTLGFEPGFKDYKNRIRYTLNLNLNSVIGYFRRGWF